MGERRDQTDASLRDERGKDDLDSVKRRAAADAEADEVMRIARQRADQIVQTARDTADGERSSQRSTDATERTRADDALAHERSGADALLAHERAERVRAVEAEADEVMRIARQRADQIVQTARDTVDSERRSATSEAGYKHADGELADERSGVDALLARERAERNRYLAEFMAVEREATNDHLVGERAHSDTMILARDEFLATVCHDLRGLLSSLLLSEEILCTRAPNGEGGDKIRQHAKNSQRVLTRMSRLLNDLLDVASIEAGHLAFVPTQVDVSEIVRETVDAFNPIATAAHITLDAAAASQPCHAVLDGGRILQVLANLISNAIKFTPAEGRVSLRLRTENNEIHFSVSDTGIGIPEEALQEVFDRYRQVSKDRRGLGLGLHISKCIVEAHGGRMWAESKPGAGSTFHFTLPSGVLRADPKTAGLLPQREVSDECATELAGRAPRSGP
ncbi:hypothetical protein BH11MYX2_BH11MYX2_25250 [soil metagenome]